MRSCTTVQISEDVASVFVLLSFGTNYPPLSGSPTYWTHLKLAKNTPYLSSHLQHIAISARPADDRPTDRPINQ